MPSAKLTALALVLAPLLAGCETLTPSLTNGGALAAFKNIPNSAQAPCNMQIAVAEHNSRYDTLRDGKEVVYKAPCQIDKPKQVPASPEPKTS